MKKIIILFFVLFIFLFPYVYSHVEHKEGNELLYYFGLIWTYGHWIIFLLLAGTCYYIRYFSARNIQHHPHTCAATEADRPYFGEMALKKFHRYFFWAMVVLLLIRVYYNISLAYAGMETHTLTFKVVEWIALGLLALYLGSCHFMRYISGGKVACFSCAYGGNTRHKFYSAQSRLNEYHGHIFWLNVAAIILLHVILILKL